MKMPRAAARPHPTIIATGAARPMAQGQATSRTARALKTAWPKLPATSHQAEEGQGGPDEHGRDEDGADPVGQPLEGGLVPLGLVDQTLQPGQHRLGRRPSPPAHQDAVTVAGATGHRVARAPLHRQRLAGEHGLVHR